MTAQQNVLLERLIEALREIPSREGLHNPYGSLQGEPFTTAYDEATPEADRIRTNNLRSYLTALLKRRSDILLCGEAPSSFGAKWTGIAFSSEREILAGKFPFADCSLLPGALNGTRRLMKEVSALYIWRALQRMDVPAVLWNALPCHPFPAGKPLKNRTPTEGEIEMGRDALRLMVDLVQPRTIVAIGRTAERALAALGHTAKYVRHPANAGSTRMLEMLEELGIIGPPPIEPQQSPF